MELDPIAIDDLGLELQRLIPDRAARDDDDVHDLLRILGDLTHDEVAPMTKLTISGRKVHRVNLWPEEGDIGTPVILPGGEVGVLTAWWNDDVGQEWKWSVEYANRARKPLKKPAP